jgi:hypothetical protein
VVKTETSNNHGTSIAFSMPLFTEQKEKVCFPD